ncbi:MAG: 2-phospho-L-lactate guanylyltransferase, partial [Actinomycetota bacterium]
RLSSVLTPLERGALTLAMLEDMLDVTLALAGWETWVISPDEVVLEVAARRGVRTLVEDRPGLFAAIRQAEGMAVVEHAHALAVLPGDLPLVTVEALTSAVRTLGPVVIASSAREGTSLLLRRPSRAIASRFGIDSFRKHLELAEAKGLPVAVIDRPELSFDLDVPGDILTLLEDGRRGRTREVCLGMDLGDRLAAHG